MKDFIKKSRSLKSKHIEDLHLNFYFSALCKSMYLMLIEQIKINVNTFSHSLCKLKWID